MKPSLGRIVLVKKNGIIIPAIIVKIWSEICVNLVAFHDGSNDFPEHNGETLWITSALLDTNELEPSENHWIWPPKV